MLVVPLELQQWAVRHGVSAQALAELSGMLGAPALPTSTGSGSEGRVQSLVRLAAPGKGMRLFRNNVGVLRDKRDVPVRFGLANDTKALNEQLKSSDLIGWRRLPITAPMVGTCVAQFVSLECKGEGWTYRGDEHEAAQHRWLSLVAADGGYARFVARAEDA
jgi:hypothetical protein